MSIGSRIYELLDEKQISQKQLANDLKISSSTLNNYIRDYREPDVETLKRLAYYFDVTMDYLLESQVRPKESACSILNVQEQELLNVFRCLKREQQDFLIEQTKLMIKMNTQKRQPLSNTISKTGTEKNE